MEEVTGEMEQQIKIDYRPNAKLLECEVCGMVFDRPTTLGCGHSFCYRCLIASISNKIDESTEKRAITMIPLCPRCHSIIWRPLGALKENVTLSALISKYALRNKQSSTPLTLPPNCQSQFHILIECQSINNTLLPHCFTQIVFATAFIDQILEQQSQANLVVLRWPGAEDNIGISGRILRHQTYHYLMKAQRNESIYKGIFQGKSFVKLLDCQQVNLKVNSLHTYSQDQNITCPLNLCLVEQLQSSNPLSLEQFKIFFDIYDRMNDPNYLRQIAMQVDERVFHERNNPKQLIYCIMRILRMQQQQVSSIAKMMDDHSRWLKIQQFLIANAHKQLVQIIKIDIPGNISSYSFVVILTIMVIFHLMMG